MSDGPAGRAPGIRPEPGSQSYEQLPELDGTWVTQDGDEASAPDFCAPDFDTAGWQDTTSPKAPTSGVRRFRKSFHTEAQAGQRHWLSIDPLPVDTSIWLDGAYIGDAERSIVPKIFDVTTPIEKRDAHVIGLQLTASDEQSHTPAHVRLFDTGAVCITRLKVLCLEVTNDSAVLGIWAELDCTKSTSVTLRTAIEGAAAPIDNVRYLAPGRSRFHWTVQVDEPELWWPRHLGSQELHQVEITVIDNSKRHTMSDARVVSTGFRSVRRKGSELEVNGTALPVRALEVDKTLDVDELASGVNTLLVSQGALTNRLLHSADKFGLLVIASVPVDARRSRESIEAYGAHPSLVAWKGPRKTLAPGNVPNLGALGPALGRSDPSRPSSPPLTHVDSSAELDEYRRKSPHAALSLSRDAMKACHLVRVVAELRRDKTTQHVDMYVVNDSGEDIADGVIALDVEGHVSDTGGVHKSWGGNAPGHSVTFVGSLTLPLLAPKAELTIDVSLLSRALAITRSVTHTTGTDGMILDVVSHGPNLASRSVAGVASKARHVKELVKVGNGLGRKISNSNNERHE